MDDMDKTIPPQRQPAGDFPESGGPEYMTEKTIPGRLERKPTGRYAVGDLILHRYKVLAELGQGGMGVVYKCFDETAGIEVALKALPPELSHNSLEMEDVKDNFQLVSKLIHQNIAASKTLERDPTTGDYYLIMECVDGEDLRRWIKRKRKEETLTPETVLPVLRQVADALDYAHAERVIHRDIKPGNIMINAAGKVKVLDFGLAAQIHTSMTRVSMAYHGTSGTGPYMAPEQWRGRAQGAAADQYALAVMAYEMLAGHLPFESTDAAVLREAVLNDTPQELDNIPIYARNAIRRAMSKEPNERFANCADFVAAFSGKKVKAPKAPKSSRKAGIVVVLVLILALAGGGIVWHQVSGKQAEAARQAEIARRQQAEAARQAKLEAERKQQAEIARQAELTRQANEKKSAALAQETYRLQARVSSRKQQIERLNVDRGQTFGKYLDTFRDDFSAGELAMKNNDVAAANTSFKSALAAAEWIETNAPLQDETKRLLAEAGQIKIQADRFDAAKLAKVDYDAATAALKSAADAGDSGKFAEAAAAAKQGKSGYESALLQARKHTVELKLDAARSAKNRFDWEKAKEYAEQALALDSSSNAAKELKSEAENNLVPKLRVVATIDGKEVNADVSFNDKTWKTPILLTLKGGSYYHGKLTCQNGGEEYRGELQLTADWLGEKTRTVALKKIDFTGTVVLPGNVKLELVKIRAGSFMMGSPKSELGHSGGEKQHRVTLTKDYWLGKYEVTQAQYEALMGKNRSSFKGASRPVENVNWEDAMAFCRKLNDQYRNQLPTGYEFTLPTEAQWEYACRAGTTTALNNGKDLTSEEGTCFNLDEVGWYDKNSGNGTHPVGQKKPNAWGLYDMHGNVYEWCHDWNGVYRGDEVDPTGPESGQGRIHRGGRWNFQAMYCRSASRLNYNPTWRFNNLGFRIALAPILSSNQDKATTQTTPAAAKRSGEFDSIAKIFAFLPGTLAEVDGKIITKDDLLTELDQRLSENKELIKLLPQQSKEQLNQLAKKMISGMVDREISRILVEKAGITPSEELARKSLLQQINALPGEQKKQLADMLKKKNTTIAEYVENMARKPDIQLGSAITEWSQKLKAQIAVSDEEAMKYKGGKINLDFVDSAHILIVPDKNDKDGRKARQKADELLARIRNGADFGQIAREESNCPSKSQNGELGKAFRGTLVPEYFDAAFRLSPREVSDVVKTQFGYHIIRLNSKGQESIDQVKDEMRQQRLEKEISAKINEQKKLSRVKITDF